MLTSRISLPSPSTPSQEDIFSSALYSLFTDDTQNSHGSPGGSLTYASPAFGDITLQIPAHPDIEEGRKLFAHYLWNAGLVAAEGIERASVVGAPGAVAVGEDGDVNGNGRELWKPKWWNVTGRRALELGAGTALPSLVSALCHASSATITDHPSSPALTTGVIQASVACNLPKAKTPTEVSVYGYVWGTETMYATDTYGKVAGKLGKYDVVVLTDCLWMPSQHANLVKTIARALDDGPRCCAIVVAGFHTGREVVGRFFDIATGGVGSDDLDGENKADHHIVARLEESSHLPRVKIAEIFEVDVNGQKRQWQMARPGEGKDEAKKCDQLMITWDKMLLKSSDCGGCWSINAAGSSVYKWMGTVKELQDFHISDPVYGEIRV